MRALLLHLLKFLHPGPSAHEVESMHKDLRSKVHESRSVAQRAVGSVWRSTKAAREATETAEGAIKLLEETRRAGERNDESE